MNPQFSSFQKIIQHPLNYKLFLLKRLPMAFISGLNIQEFTENTSIVQVKFKWLNQNPFRSIYFAVQSMAAELSTGILAFGQLYRRQPSVSMLVVKLNASFYKKATGKVNFTCTDGNKITEAIEQTIQTKQSVTIDCTSIGKNEAGEEVAQFIFTWSFKAKN